MQMKTLLLVVIAALFFAACRASSSHTVEQSSTRAAEQAPQVIAANETAAIARLKSIVTAEFSHAMDTGGEYATLEALIQQGTLPDPSGGKLNGYRFEVKVKPGGFEATAVPERFGITGKRSFFIDETRVLRAADKGGSRATVSDPQV